MTSSSRQLDAYIRVSDVHGRSGESFISVDQQRQKIDAWAKAHGHEIVAWFEELDVSGGKTDRPMLNEVMARIEARQTGGVVVAKLDRFGRTLAGTLQLIGRIRDAGALFASVADSFDISTPTGRLTLNMMLSIAQWELERIGDNWFDAKVAAVKRGCHVGPTPFGYVKGDDARLSPDPDWGYIITELFERRAAGESWGAIRKWVEAEGAPCPQVSGWNSSRLSKVIGMEVYLGVVEFKPKDGTPGARTEGAHQPLTDLATWHAAQQRRGPRYATTGSQMLLKGLVRCAGCRYGMKQQPATGRPQHPHYMCARAASAGDCKAPAHISSEYSRLDRVGLDEYVTEALLARWPKMLAHAYSDDELDELKRAAEAARVAAEQNATDLEAEQALGRAAWLARGDALRVEAERTERAYQEALSKRGGPAPSKTLVQEWRSGRLTMAQKREQLASAIQAVFIKRGDIKYHDSRGKLRTRITGASPATVHIVWADDPVVEVPRQGQRDYVLRPFVFPVADDPVDAGVIAA